MTNQPVGVALCQQPQSQFSINSPTVSAENYRGRLLANHKSCCPQLYPLAALSLPILHLIVSVLDGKLLPSISGAAHGWNHLYTVHLRVEGLFSPNKDSLLLMTLKQILPALHWYMSLTPVSTGAGRESATLL